MMNAKEKINQFVDVRTASDTGFSFVTEKLDISTPLGVKELKGQLPFLPGDEEALKEELNRLENILGLVEDHAKTLARIKETFHCLKDITGSIERSRGEVLSQIEIFEIKSFIIYVNALRGILVSYDGEIPEEFIPEETKVLMDLLDPRGDKTNSFYIYDEYSKKLAELRGEKKKLEAEIRKVQKILKDKIQSEHGIILTPKFDIVIPKSSDQVEAADNCSELNRIGEDYSSVTFGLAMPQEVESLVEAKEALALKAGEGTLNDMIVNAIATIGENISLRRFEIVNKADDEIFGSYTHQGGSIVAVTVVKGTDDPQVAKNMAMQVASMNPTYVSRNDMPKDVVDHERSVQEAIVAGDETLAAKPDKVKAGIVEGRVSKSLQDMCLVDQEFFLDTNMKCGAYLKQFGAEVVKFVKFKVGEGIEKRQDDFAAEVAAMAQGK